jgi:DNA polymerase elongation subunit (family B)
VVLAVASSSGVTTLPAANGVCGAQPIELRSFTSEAELLLAFERFVAEVDPDLLLTYDARCLGLVSTRHAELLLGIGLGPKPPKPAAHKGKVKAAGGGTSSPLQLGRQRGEPIKVVPMLATDCH